MLLAQGCDRLCSDSVDCVYEYVYEMGVGGGGGGGGGVFFFSSRRRHTRFLPVSWARRCV